MRVSCNGCRVLRKACDENCTIRPCLQWIRSPESQANATVFLAKFYGRAGLTNLINAGPPNLRPAIFRSLLYEACGRLVNPIYGSVGLYESGSWKIVHDAVDAVLRGEPTPSNTAGTTAYDIRHVSKEDNCHALNRVQSRRRFKRAGKSGRVESHGSSHHQHHHSDAATEINEERECRSLSDPAVYSDGEIQLNLTLGL